MKSSKPIALILVLVVLAAGGILYFLSLSKKVSVPVSQDPLTTAPQAETAKESAPLTDTKSVKVAMKTSAGIIKLELDNVKAPLTVANFVTYAKSGFYNQTIFHRVINGFMIQGGGFAENMTEKPTQTPVKNESSNGLKNDRGTIAMARTQDPDSATAQFYINLVDNMSLNASESSGAGYAVFGKVTEGMDIVDTISKAKTGQVAGFSDVPVKAVFIESVSIEN